MVNGWMTFHEVPVCSTDGIIWTVYNQSIWILTCPSATTSTTDLTLKPGLQSKKPAN